MLLRSHLRLGWRRASQWHRRDGRRCLVLWAGRPLLRRRCLLLRGGHRHSLEHLGVGGVGRGDEEAGRRLRALACCRLGWGWGLHGRRGWDAQRLRLQKLLRHWPVPGWLLLRYWLVPGWLLLLGLLFLLLVLLLLGLLAGVPVSKMGREAWSLPWRGRERHLRRGRL